MQRIFLRSMSLLIGSFISAVLVHSCTQRAIYNIYDSTTIEIMKRIMPTGKMITKDNDTCKISDFYVIFNFDFRSITHQPSNSDWRPFSTANAYQPGPAIMHHLEKLKDLKFYTLNDFNTNYPAGSDLTDLITIAMDSDSYLNPHYVSIREFIQKNNENLERITDDKYYLNTTGGSLRFRERPNSPAYHRFLIKVITEGETLLTDTTANVYIIP